MDPTTLLPSLKGRNVNPSRFAGKTSQMCDKRLSTAFQPEDRAVVSRPTEPCSLPLGRHPSCAREAGEGGERGLAARSRAIAILSCYSKSPESRSLSGIAFFQGW